MKKQILTLIIGILIGAIITTTVFLVIKSNSSSKMPNFGDRPEMSESDRQNRGRNSRNNTNTIEGEENMISTESVEETN